MPVAEKGRWPTRDLRKIIKESRRWSNNSVNAIYFPHQLKKFVVTHSCKYFNKHKYSLPEILGSASWNTLKENYLGEVPPLRCICVLPLGMLDSTKLRSWRKQ